MRSINLLESWLTRHGFQSKKVSLGSPDKSEFLLISKIGLGKELLFSAKRLSFPQSTSATREVTSDKTMAYDLAKYLDISHPKTIVINANDYDQKLVSSFIDEHGTAVIKPYNGLQSRGVCLDISDIDSAQRAIQSASKVSQKVIVQSQFKGQEIRFAVVNKKVRSALLRQKPQVVGDGRSTFSELIESENTARKQIKNSLVEYPQLQGSLLKTDTPLSYIPQKNEVIEISKATMIRNGASIYEVINDVNEDYIGMAEKICAPLIGSLICVDIMIKDYRKPATKDNYNLIELNLGMSLPLCYSCRDGNHFTIIEDYLGPKVLEEFELLK